MSNSKSDSLIRGTSLLMINQALFMLFGYVVHIFLARKFGPEIYGIFGVVLSILTWFELAVVRGIPTAVQNYIAKDQPHAYVIKKFCLQIQLLFSTVLFLALFGIAPYVANLLNDARLSFYIRIASFDIVVYAAYALYAGVENGFRHFKRQALMGITYSATRLAAIIILVAIGFSLQGALIGNIIGSFGGLFLGLVYANVKKDDKILKNKWELIQYVIPTTFYFLISNLLYNIDLWFIKSSIEGDAAGYYTTAQIIGRVPLFLFFALSFSLLPLLSKSVSENNVAKTRDYIDQGVRFLLLLLVPMIAIVISTSENLIRLLYSAKFIESAAILNILIVGFSFLAFYTIMTTVMLAKNKPSVPFIISAALVIVDIVLNIRFIPVWGTLGAASATTITAGIGAIVAGIIVFRDFNTNLKLFSIVRIIAAGVIVFIISNLYEFEGILCLVNYMILFLIYVVLLFIMKEIRTADLAAFKNMIINKK